MSERPAGSPVPAAVRGPGDERERVGVEVGVLRGAYGVKGWVRIQPHAAEAAVLKSVDAWVLRDVHGVRRTVRALAVKPHPHGLVAQLEGLATPEAADALRGAAIEVPRDRFPPLAEGEVYQVDLLGLRVVNRSGHALGTVRRLQSNGVQDLLEVEGPAGVLLIPMLPQYVERLDVAAGRVEVDWEVEWS